MERVAGTLEFSANGKVFNIVGTFTYHLGTPRREVLVGPDRVHGFKEEPMAPFIKGESRDSYGTDVKNDICLLTNATIVLKIANSKRIMFEKAVYTGSGEVETGEGKINLEFGAKSAEEIR
jgi:hypothetical protein